MLNRRHLRIKTLQILYSYFQNENKDMRRSEKQLIAMVEEVHDTYLSILQLLFEIKDIENILLEEGKKKHIPSAADKAAKKILGTNTILLNLFQNQSFKAALKPFENYWNIEKEIIRSLYNKFKKSSELLEFNKISNPTFEEQKALILFLIKKIVLKSADLNTYLEEKYINWNVDKEVISGMLNRTFKAMEEASFPKKEIIIPITMNWEEDKEFIINLFTKTVLNNESYQKLINEKIKNWEPDRVALMDVLLMKLAICELLNFNYIPIKVSMNEYIEISKEYSSPKSKVFINGILDKIVFDLEKNNQLNKSGRGLLK